MSRGTGATRDLDLQIPDLSGQLSDRGESIPDLTPLTSDLQTGFAIYSQCFATHFTNGVTVLMK